MVLRHRRRAILGGGTVPGRGDRHREPLWERGACGGFCIPSGWRAVSSIVFERCPAPRSWHEVAHRYPLANLNILVTILLLLVLVFCAGWYPVEVGRLFGAAALGFLALGTWVSVLTALQLMQPRYSVSLVVLLVAVSTAWQLAPPLSPASGSSRVNTRPSPLRIR